MKKLNKLQINSEKLLNNEELISLRGGYGGGYDCECGTNGQEAHWCSISWEGTFCFSGWACGDQSYIISVYPPSSGYTVSCGSGISCNSMHN